jgi:hypothetical protein
MSHTQNRIGRILFPIYLMTILVSASSCTVERFDVSITDPFGLSEEGATNNTSIKQDGADHQMVDQLPNDDADKNTKDRCYPSGRSAVMELVTHGYDARKPDWKVVADWFRRLEPLAKSLPPCE